ncbi:MAG: hypothetical protein R3B47_06055 [Bacteroidia bacterium]
MIYLIRSTSLLVLLTMCGLLWSQSSPKRCTITGHVTTASGEVLINAKVFDTESGLGCLTNNFGFFQPYPACRRHPAHCRRIRI